jgi:ribose 5-phosphate isomerase A
MTAKEAAAAKAVEMIKDGMSVGLGSGSTASCAIRMLGERVRHGLRINAVATSRKSELLANDCGIELMSPGRCALPDIAIDGADEVDEAGSLIKGGGGSLLREKIIAFASKQFYVMVDNSKLVGTLGRAPLPVEVTPFGSNLTLRHLQALGSTAVFRKSGEENFVTDNGNFIIDCSFQTITEPSSLDARIKAIPGVVETGLFPAVMVTALLVGYPDGTVQEKVIGD